MALNLQRRQMFIENSSGTLIPWALTANGGVKVDTELDFTSGTIIGNLYLFKNSSGTAAYGLVDSSNRQIISPSSTITSIPSGTQDVDVVANSIGLMESTGGTLTTLQGTSPWVISGTTSPSGTQDIDITANSVGLMQSTNGTLTVLNASGNPFSEVSPRADGTMSNPVGINEVAMLARSDFFGGDTGGTLQTLVADPLGALYVINDNDITDSDDQDSVSRFTGGLPMFTLGGVLNESNGKIQRMRNTASVSGGTMSTGLLATGNIGYDGSAWRPIITDTSGNTLISSNSTITSIPSGTQDVDVTANSIGLMSNTGGSVTSIPSGTQDIDIIANSIGLMQSTSGTLTAMTQHYNGSAWTNRDTPVIKDEQYVAAVTSGTVWTPAGGKKFVMTDMIISTKDATSVSILDGTTKVFEAYLASNGGVVSNFKTPIQSTTANNSLHITTDTASTLSITTTGYEI